MASVKFRGFEYEIPTEFTNREMISIENVSGKSAGEIGDGIKHGRLTWGAMCAISHVAMTRQGAKIELDELLDADMDALEFVGDKEPEEVASPLDESVASQLVSPDGPDTTVIPEGAGNPS